MRLTPRGHPERMLPVEITPMVDVVFLLIIFFMTTAQFAQMTRAELDLPREPGEQEQLDREAELVINLTRDGEMIIRDRAVTMDGLTGEVHAAIDRAPAGDPRQVKVLLRADREADTTQLNRIIARLQSIGVGTARVATEAP